MELLQLKYFRESVLTRNFSHTAQKFNVPQSAVSQSIKRLELELGTPLFNRQNNHISPNECGNILFNHVNLALTELEKGIDAIKNPAADIAGMICLLIESNRRFLTQCISEFKGLYPHIDFKLYHQAPSYETVSFDFVVSSIAPKNKEYVGVPIVRERLLLSVSKKHPFAGEESISLEKLKDEPMISTHSGSSLHTSLMNLFATSNFVPNITIFCDDPAYVRQYTRMGLGLSLFPEVSWRGVEEADVVHLPFANGTPERITSLYYKAETGSEVARLFREFLLKKVRTKG